MKKILLGISAVVLIGALCVQEIRYQRQEGDIRSLKRVVLQIDNELDECRKQATAETLEREEPTETKSLL